jgi:hypothetical protein
MYANRERRIGKRTNEWDKEQIMKIYKRGQ